MKFGSISVEEAAGKILAHKLLDDSGRKIFNKGHYLVPADVKTLSELNLESVIVATMEPGDLNENEAAQRVGNALAGPGIRVIAPGVGRANLMADAHGPLRINVPLLERLNSIYAGITVATLRQHTLVHPGQLAALIKIIPFAIPSARIADVEAVARESGSIISVRVLQPGRVALIVSGPESARERLLGDFVAPTRNRLEKLGSTLDTVQYVAHTEAALVPAICEQRDTGRDLILLAGVSAIIDQDDLVPSALRAAGGTVTHFGVPVDPGSLLMLGYIGETPVVGAPGCVKSPKTNVIDWILPRLLAGERLTGADLVAMGHGGLLDDISERPMPRRGVPPQ